MKRTLYTLITTDQGGFVLTLYRILLFPFYLLYGAVISIRNLCYTSGFIKQKKLPCSVISVGNIVAGGTGKTPAVAAIARLLQKDAYKVGILLRGYKGNSKNKVTIVSDGEKRLCSREVCGDEADMLARQLPNIPVVVGFLEKSFTPYNCFNYIRNLCYYFIWHLNCENSISCMPIQALNLIRLNCPMN